MGTKNSYCRDHLGNVYKSISEMCRAYGISRTTFNARMKSNYSLEEALTAKIAKVKNKGKCCRDHLGNEYPSVTEMCRAYEVPRDIFSYRIRSNWSLDKALTTKVTNKCKCCRDHLGNEYPSITEMCNAYGVSRNIFNTRRKLNWGLEKALTTKVATVRDKGKCCRDHLGNEYPSITEMCKAYGISGTIFSHRIKSNWGLEKALTTKITGKCMRCKDHLGNEYPSITEMCKAYGISRSAYKFRTDSNWSLEQTLTGKLGTICKCCKDHLGNEYASVIEMCKAYGVSRSAYESRMRSNWSLEKALTTKGTKVGNKGKCCRDHLGNEYPSVAEMCEAYGISRATFNSRMRLNWSLEEALTTGISIVRTTSKCCRDHLGNEYPSITEMCKAYGISRTTFNARMKSNYSLEESLTLSAIARNTGKRCRDHLGNEYPSVTEMCIAYGISQATYRYRINNGLSLKEALTTKKRKE